MNEQISRLLAVGTETLAPRARQETMAAFIAGDSQRLKRELCALLWERNGFYVFDSALLIRPFDAGNQPLGVLQWNRPDTWKAEYKADLKECVFFAEDLFGVQFCIRGEDICSFDPETGAFTKVADKIEDWVSWILAEPDERTGLPLARKWRAINGSLQPGWRLFPKVPFVAGGDFGIPNLVAAKDAECMRFRASIANQLLGVPDGTKIQFAVGKEP